MKTKVLLTSMMLISALGLQAQGRRVSFTADIQRPLDAASPTVLEMPKTLLTGAYGMSNMDKVDAALKTGNLSMIATYTSSSGKESFYLPYTIGSGIGHWFNSTGIATSKVANRRISVKYEDGGRLLVSHNADANIEEGSEFVVKESFVSKSVKDTITYVFNVKIGGTKESIKSNQTAIAFGRRNYVDSWAVTPQVREAENEWKQGYNFIQVNAGSSFTLSATPKDKDATVRYSWQDKSGKTIKGYKSSADLTFTNAQEAQSGMYILKVRSTGKDNKTKWYSYLYFVDVQPNPGAFYDWEQNTATFSYDFRDEYPELPEPQKIHKFYKRTANGGTAPANYYAGKWWTIYWGDNLNPEVGKDSATVYAAAKNMIDRFDNDFAYLRNQMGWPPDASARNGYKSIIYIFGSGLTNDNTSQEEKGGYQSATQADGATWACVWASWYPFSRARKDKDYGDNEWQVGAMVHEGIHATFADMPGVKGSSWFHEAGNTWAQSKMEALKAEEAGKVESDDATAGWLDSGPFLAPFMPIECYSGWLQDGSFGGPQAQGVDKFTSDGKKICTWRNILGGTQYGNSFPTILSSFAGIGSVPWIWRYCDYRVLEGIGDYVGEEAMRKIILQYRSRMSIYDFGYGSKAYRNAASNAFAQVIGPEWEPYDVKCDKWAMTPYAQPVLNDNDGWLAPDTLTNPGWSGANFIPIHVAEDQDTVCIEFRPEDTNMQAQLCYRTSDGKSYYSQPVYCGTMKMDITDRPANGVVICVVANTDYIYDDSNGEWQRSHHWDYRIRLGKGAMAVADPYQKWFFYDKKIVDPGFDPTGIEKVEDINSEKTQSTYKEGIFNMNGQRLTTPQKGLNIINGKKVVVM